MHIKEAFNMCEVSPGSPTAASPTPLAPWERIEGPRPARRAVAHMARIDSDRNNLYSTSAQTYREKSIRVTCGRVYVC